MRLKKDNKGAAMIVALVVMTVLMMFCLSLLLVVYSLYTSTLKKNSTLQCKEACKTMSFELQSELTEPVYTDYESQSVAQKSVTGTGGDSLWFYIRYNIWQDSWPYYSSTERGHGKDTAYRYFTITPSEGVAGMTEDIKVCIYWEKDNTIDDTVSDDIATDGTGQEADGSDVLEQRADTILHVIVTCSKNEQSYSIETEYTLMAGEYADITDKTEEETMLRQGINPYNNSIYKFEKWQWVFSERE